MATETTRQAARPARRTIVKGAAWAVPAVTVASAAPAMAASPVPPPPSFDFDNAYKNPGNSCTRDCVPMQSYGTPLTVTNPSDEDFYIMFTSYFIGSSNVGVNSVVANPDTCAPVPGCPTGTCGTTSSNAVCVPAGSGTIRFYVTSNGYGSSPNEGQSIGWSWIRKSDCVVELSGTATSDTSPPGCFPESSAEADSTTEDSTTEDSTTEDSTTEDSTTEESTTEESTTPAPSTDTAEETATPNG